MRWTPSQILKITGLALIGATPFLVAFLLLPSGEEQPEDGERTSAQAADALIPLEFPYSSPSPSPPPPPSPDPPPSPEASPTSRQCGNGRDDDRDGRVDLADPGCSSRTDNSESPDPSPRPAPSPSPNPSPSAPPPSPDPPPVQNCSDEGDNDGDGWIDGSDPGCGDGNEGPFNFPPPGPAGDDDDDFFPPTTTTTMPLEPSVPSIPEED